MSNEDNIPESIRSLRSWRHMPCTVHPQSRPKIVLLPWKRAPGPSPNSYKHTSKTTQLIAPSSNDFSRRRTLDSMRRTLCSFQCSLATTLTSLCRSTKHNVLKSKLAAAAKTRIALGYIMFKLSSSRRRTSTLSQLIGKNYVVGCLGLREGLHGILRRLW